MIGNNQASELRQKINEGLKQMQNLMAIAQERSEMLQASLYKRSRRCGRKGCECEQGKLHRDMALSIWSDGQSRLVSLVDMDIGKVGILTENYRRLRKARAKLVRTFGGMLKDFDTLGRLKQIKVQDLH